MLERLDRIARDVELCLTAVEEFLGLEGVDTEPEDSEEEDGLSDGEQDSKTK